MHFQKEVATFKNKWEKQNAMSYENSTIHFEKLKKKKDAKLISLMNIFFLLENFEPLFTKCGKTM